MYWRTLCFECYKKEPQKSMNEEDCLYLFALIKMCFLLLSVYFQVQVVAACKSSGGNSSSFDNSNICYLSLVSFRFCCIGSVQTPYSLSMLCSTCVVLLSSLLSEWSALM